MHFSILGAGGFVGSHLLKRLQEQGSTVYAPARHDESWLKEDLGHVFYCAGLTNDYHARPFDTVEGHVSLLARLLREGRFERLVYLSSTRLYDSLEEGGGEETAVLRLDPTSPRHLYDLSKALGENLCLTQSAGRACVARLSCVYSDALKEGGFLAQVLPRAATGESFAIQSSPYFTRDYVHVDDVVSMLCTLLVNDAQGIYNVAAGSNTDNADLLDAIRAHTGSLISCSHRQRQLAAPVSIDKAQRDFAYRPRQLLDHLPVMLDHLRRSPHEA
ncbi:NAD-dependent epimerase/dehydratase family protein [Pseudomonas sp.]|uniref:NAD-dependent epimerase/dehydratase family protein n=1 Tax=Pseudomonas sp. TaxID=306 RepID=UPI003D0EED68